MAMRTGTARWVGTLGIVAVLAAMLATAAGAAVRRSAAGYPVPGPPVVLITGLDDSTPGMAPGGNCGGVGTMATLCAALQQAGYQVYVASSASGGGAVINNHNAFDPNGRSLARYLTNTVKTPALLVGHSMGGIFSRIAISRYGAKTAGLVTIASPHDGSFGADLLVGAANFPCFSALCTALKAVANKVLGNFGSTAVNDLTHASRTADNATLGAPGVPTWTYAGTACHGPSFLTQYLFPNDGIVGQSSAFGTGANLGSTTRSSSAAYHQSTLQTVLSPLCGSAGIELGDSSVIGAVLGAAGCVSKPGCRTAADVAATAAAKRHRRSIRTTLTLLAGHTQTVQAGSTTTVSTSTTLVASTPFTVTCNGQQVPALPALGNQIFGIPTGTVSCTRVTVAPATSTTSAPAPLHLGVLSNPGSVKARLVSRRGTLRITLTAGHRIRSVSLTRRGRTLRGVHRARHGARKVTLTVPVKRAGQATIAATVGGRRYVATIPPLG
jgi:pimeloyl-ACP methyl ester carboxylesterase